MQNSHLGWCGTGRDAAGAAVVADVSVIIGGVVVYNRVVVYVGVADARGVDIGDRPVVHEVAVVPIAAVEASAVIAVAIRNTAVEADVRTPVSLVEAVDTGNDSPIAGGPERAFVGRCYPDAGYPVVAAVIGVAPVAGSPYIAGFRAFGLLVIGKRRGRLLGGDALLVTFVIAIVARSLVLGRVAVVRTGFLGLLRLLIGTGGLLIGAAGGRGCRRVAAVGWRHGLLRGGSILACGGWRVVDVCGIGRGIHGGRVSPGVV